MTLIPAGSATGPSSMWPQRDQPRCQNSMTLWSISSQPQHSMFRPAASRNISMIVSTSGLSPATLFYVASTSACQCCSVQSKKEPTLLGAASSVPHLRSLGGFSSLTTVFIGQLCVCAALLNCTRWSQFKSVTDAEGSARPFLRKARSDVWAQFMRKKDVARGNLCRKEYKYTSSTSNSQKHVRTAHPDVGKEMDHDT